MPSGLLWISAWLERGAISSLAIGHPALHSSKHIERKCIPNEAEAVENPVTYVGQSQLRGLYESRTLALARRMLAGIGIVGKSRVGIVEADGGFALKFVFQDGERCKMKPVMILLLAIATYADQPAKPKDVEGWGKIKWGITIAQAKAAYGTGLTDGIRSPPPPLKQVGQIPRSYSSTT